MFCLEIWDDDVSYCFYVVFVVKMILDVFGVVVFVGCVSVVGFFFVLYVVVEFVYFV